jgi:hypothetical protein
VNLTRRRFFQALAASALAVGVPLPVGMPTATIIQKSWYLTDADMWYMDGMTGLVERVADATALQQSGEDTALMLCDLKANRSNRLKSDHASTSDEQRV